MEPSNKNIDTNLFLFEFRLQCMVKTFVHQPKTLSSLYYGILSGNLYILVLNLDIHWHQYDCYTFITLSMGFLISEWWYWTKSQTMSCFSVNFWLQHLLVSSCSNVTFHRNVSTVCFYIESYSNLKIISVSWRESILR